MNSLLQTQANEPNKLRGFSEIQRRPVEPSHSSWPAVLFYTLLAYTALLVLPDYIQVVMPGLDASWGFALNHFIHTGYKFGPDLVFTYGPLGFLAVPEHISWNLPVALTVRFAVWAVLFWQLMQMWKAGERFGAFILVAGLLLGNKLYFYYWDYLVIAAILVLLVRMMHSPGGYVRPVILSVLVGIAFLMKPTVFIMALLLSVLYAVHRLRAARRSMHWSERGTIAALFLVGPIAYLIYNPSFQGLFEYVKGGLEISKGFAAAMSLDTSPHDASLLTGTCLVMGLAVAIAVWNRSVARIGALMVLTAAWVAFRHGFVRSDGSHAADFFAFDILVFAVLLAQLKRGVLWGAYLLAFFVFCFLALSGVADRWSPFAWSWWSAGVNLSSARGLLDWDREMAYLDHAADPLFQTRPASAYASQVSGSKLLVFPWDLASAAHQQVELVPLYVVQAYSAHTRYLDEACAKRMQRPLDHVVVEWSDIDGRNALMDVPATWMSLFANFVPQDRTADSLLLRRREQPLSLAYKSLGAEEYRPDLWARVPLRRTPVAMSIDLKPTIFGSLLATAYKIAPIVLEVRTSSGSIQSFRVTADVLSSPSFINCLPLSFDRLNELWSANLAKDPIVALRLTGHGLQHLSGSSYRFFSVEGTTVAVADAALGGH